MIGEQMSTLHLNDASSFIFLLHLNVQGADTTYTEWDTGYGTVLLDKVPVQRSLQAMMNICGIYGYL